jgi:hypothetical protein
MRQMAAHPHRRRKNYEVCLWNLAVLLFWSMVTLPCAGQTPGSTVSGAITSAAGAPIANAAIAVKNLGTNETISLAANVDGSYVLQGLALGRYEITASAPGYAPAVITVSMTQSSSPSANLVLQDTTPLRPGPLRARLYGTSSPTTVPSVSASTST